MQAANSKHSAQQARMAVLNAMNQRQQHQQRQQQQQQQQQVVRNAPHLGELQAAIPQGIGAGMVSGRGARAPANPAAQVAARAAANMFPPNARQQQPAPQQPTQPSQPPQQQRPGNRQAITQEQVIVGHFCRFAIKTMARLTQGHARAKEFEDRLKEHIKNVWARWVRKTITRPQLLDSVNNFVRRSAPSATNIDVIRDFKRWYEREYELQKRRSSAVSRGRVIGQPTQPQATLPPTHPPQTLPVPSKAATTTNASVVTPSQITQPRQQGTGRGASKASAAGRGSGGGRGISKPSGGKSVSLQNMNNMKKEQMLVMTGGRGQGLLPSAGRAVVVGRSDVVGRGAAIGQPISAGRGSPSNGRGSSLPKTGTAGKSMVGGKSIPGNRAGPASKPKGGRKNASSKAPVKQSPKGVMNKPGSRPPPANPADFQMSHAPGSIANGKRPFESSVDSPIGSQAKKSKQAAAKMPKSAPSKKKPASGVPPPLAVKGKAPPARPELKGAPGKGPATSTHAGVANGALKSVTGNQSSQNGPPAKKARRVDDGPEELDALNDIVDIEDEEDRLGRDAGGLGGDAPEVYHFGADMLLTGTKLRTKMQRIARLHGVSEKMTPDCMELMSLAVRERLIQIVEGLKQVSAAKFERQRLEWKTKNVGIDLYSRLSSLRDDEERQLKNAADARVRRKKEQEEAEAKKLSGEESKIEKSSKDVSAAAEAERKEKLALEKKRKEDSSQIDALHGLMRRRKKNTTIRAGGGLAPLGPLGKKVLPPIQPRNDSRTNGKGVDPLSKLEPLGGLISLGRTTNPTSMASRLPPLGAKKNIVKTRVTLKDTLFLMKRDVKMRRSTLIFRWLPRVDEHRLPMSE